MSSALSQTNACDGIISTVTTSVATLRPLRSASSTINGRLPDLIIRAASTAWASIPARPSMKVRPVTMTSPLHDVAQKSG